MIHFKLLLLTPRFQQNDTYKFFIEDTISEFFSQRDSYLSKERSILSAYKNSAENEDYENLESTEQMFLNDSSQNYLETDLDHSKRKNTTCYTYNEKFSKSLNGQKTLTFDLDKNLMIENEWKENPFVHLISIGTQLLLIDNFNNEYIFTVKNIKYNFKEINTTYNITCEDSFTYQTIRQNSGYTLENDPTSSDFIGALNVDEWAKNYITKDCHIFYNYISLEDGIYETKNKEIFTFRTGDKLVDVNRIIKEPYQPALKDSEGNIIEERDNIYFETIPFSCSNSNANAALISLAESLGMQIKTFEHAVYSKLKRTGNFICYFWFEPQKNDKRLGLTYSPKDSIQSFGLTHAGDSLTTVLNVEGPEYEDEIISLIPNVPGIFLDLFNSSEWKNSGYAPGFFSSYCGGREYSTIIPNIIAELDLNTNKRFQIKNMNGSENLTIPQLFNKVKFRTDNNYTIIPGYTDLIPEVIIEPQTHKLYLQIETWDVENPTSADILTYKIYENEEIPVLRKYNKFYLTADEVDSGLNFISSDKIILYFYRDITIEEKEFAEMADRCPWLENKIIDFSYYLDNNIISKDEYTSLMNIFENKLRIINGQLMFYAQSYYTALHERTKELAQLVSNLDLLGANCEASIIQPLTTRGAVDTMYVEDFKNIYNDILGFNTIATQKKPILDYDDLITEYLNKYINSQQNFLKNIYNFSRYFYTKNSFAEKALYPYSININQSFNPEVGQTKYVWYGFDKTNYELLKSDFKYYVGYQENEEDEDETLENYGRPLIPIFKKDLQEGYLYNAIKSIVYNNKDSYSQTYIVNEEYRDQIQFDTDTYMKYDEDRDFYLAQLKIRIKGLGLTDRCLSSTNQLFFENRFDIDKNEDYAQYTRQLEYGESLCIKINENYYAPICPNDSQRLIHFTSWEEEEDGKYYTYSEPLRFKQIIDTTGYREVSYRLVKASSVDLKKTYWNNEIGDPSTHYIHEKEFYEPINASYNTSSPSTLSEIDFRQAYNNMADFAYDNLIYRSTNKEEKWNSTSSFSKNTGWSFSNDVYKNYIRNLPIDNVYVKTNLLKENNDATFEVINKSGKNYQYFKEGWDNFLQGAENYNRTTNPYGYKIYQPISFVSNKNKDSLFRNVAPNLWKPIVSSAIAAFIVLPAATVAAAALTAAMWIWYYNAYSPGTDGRSNHDFFGASVTDTGVDDDDNWDVWNNNKSIQYFFKNSNGLIDVDYYKNILSNRDLQYDARVIGSSINAINYRLIKVDSPSNLRSYFDYGTTQIVEGTEVVANQYQNPWIYNIYWNKIGLTASNIQEWYYKKSDNASFGNNLYLKNPHFLRPVTLDESVKKGKIYKLFIIGTYTSAGSPQRIFVKDYSKLQTFLSGNSLINTVWYYPIYNQLQPIDLSQVNIEGQNFAQLCNATYYSQGFDSYNIVDLAPNSVLGVNHHLIGVIFEELDYKQVALNNIEVTGNEKYYTTYSNDEINLLKENDFTKGTFYYPLFEETLVHPTSFTKDETYYADKKGKQRVYTIYQLKNSKNSKWQYGYLNSSTYEWESFDSGIKKYSFPLVKNEINIEWKNDTYYIKSINSNFLPFYKEAIFTDPIGNTFSGYITIDGDNIILNGTIGEPILLDKLTNGDFWFKYHQDIKRPLLQQYAIAVETKLTEYWSAAYTNSKYCDYFIPESWSIVNNDTNNFFANRIVLKIDNNTSLNPQYIPSIQIYKDENNKTIFKKYYYKYISGDIDPTDLINAENQEEIQRNIRANPGIMDIFNNLEEISISKVICTEQHNISYYYVESGGKTWRDFIQETTHLSLNYFSGLYKMTLYKILKSYESLPMTEYYRLKKEHDAIWSNDIFQHFGYLVLENYYKDEKSTTPQELYQAAINAFRDYAQPERQYNLTLIDIASLQGYKGQELRIGDAIQINASEFYNEYDQIFNSLSQYLFITDINYNLRNATDISVTVNAIKYQDKLIQKLVKLIK